VKNGARATNAVSTVIALVDSVNVHTVKVVPRTKTSNWMNYHSWAVNAPKTAQVIVLATSGVLVKATVRATAPTAPVSTKVRTCELLENKLITVVSKYITA
jgi:hypothetical protein